MVHGKRTYLSDRLDLSVLALSSRFDGLKKAKSEFFRYALSVLALSSRFDGHLGEMLPCFHNLLSVLALSSRFDGPEQCDGYTCTR